jgi:hypothetical protein
MSTTAERSRRRLRELPPFPLAVLAACVLVLAAVSLLQNFVAGLLEVVLLILGLWGSYVLGQSSIGGGDVRPRARGSYRRMATLHAQLYALTGLIAKARDGFIRGDSDVRERAISSLEFIEFAVGQNLSVISDAMEDWADMVPDEVNDLRRGDERPQIEWPRGDVGFTDVADDEVDGLQELEEEGGA